MFSVGSHPVVVIELLHGSDQTVVGSDQTGRKSACSNWTIIQMVYLGKMVEQVEMFNKIKSFNFC